MTVPKKIADLIQSSGNNFHSKVARWFSDNGWHVIVSPYYMDQTQGKAREIDLVAERLWPVTDAYGHPNHALAVRLFIECKFISSDSVFWFANKDLASARELVCSNGVFRENNRYTEDHHYLSGGGRVAKVFATDNARAPENEPFYKALNQALNAMTSMSGHPVTISSGRRAANPKAILEYPVVVCSSFDRMYAVDFDGDSPPRAIAANFQLEIRYAYLNRQQRPRNDYFLLDVVAFDMLADFQGVIDKGTKAGAFLIGE